MEEAQLDQKKILIEKSAELFMRYGIKSVTMDDIASKLGISKKTIYQYVDNKNELLSQVVSNIISQEKEFILTIQSSSENAILEMLDMAKHAIQNLRKLSGGIMFDLQKYYQTEWSKLESLHNEFIYQAIKNNLERGKAEGLYRPEINSDIIAKIHIATCFAMVEEDIFPLKNYSKDELLNEYFHFHINGIVSAKGMKILQENKYE